MTTLAYFDRNVSCRQVIADASPVGLGAVIVQEHEGTLRPICYASRTLSSVERRYSQTEKEALALVWACERFHQYLYGLHFELVTDHNRWKSFIRQSQNRQLALNAGFSVCSRTISASVTSLVRRTSQTLSHVYLSIRTKINSRQSSQRSQSVSSHRAVHQTLYRSRTSSKPLQKTVNSCLSGPRSSVATSRVYLGPSLLFATSSQSLATLYSEARASYHPLPFTAASLTSPMKAIMVS